MASADPQTVVKAYNAKASSGGQLSGQKRISVLALMKAPREAVKTVVNTVSVLGSIMSPWTDEFWAEKSMMPNFTPRKYGEVWNKRLATTAESFTCMVQWQSHEAIKKLPQLRRKLDKLSIEESSQISALICSLRSQLLSEYDVTAADVDREIFFPFWRGDDSQLNMTAQGLLHTKPPKINLQDLPSIAEFIEAHVSKLEKSQFGMQKTAELMHHIEIVEIELIITKLLHDIDQFKNFLRRCRTCLCVHGFRFSLNWCSGICKKNAK